MSTRKRTAKRNNENKFLGIIIVLLLVVITVLCLFKEPNDFSYDSKDALPMLQLTTKKQIVPENEVRSNDEAIHNGEEAPNADDYYLILVNEANPIPDNYKVNLVELSNGQSVDKSIYPALQAMFDAARVQNIFPTVASGYRTASKQQELLDEKIAAFIFEGYDSSEATKKANEWVATPGTSEHQLGLAVDINADGINSTGNEVYSWLAKNAHTFGFICRYPAEKSHITGISHEPWHYRYVGIDAATEMYQQSLCLEEYLETLS